MTAAARWSLALLLCFGVSSHAGLLRLESETLSSLKNDETSRTKSLNYEYLGANYINETRTFEFNSDIGFYANPSEGRSDFDLYLLNANYKLIPDRLRFYAGRDFDVQHSVRAAFMDSIGADFWLWQKRLKLGAFAGNERKVELRSQQVPVWGVYTQYQTSSFHPTILKSTYLERKAERLVKLAAHKTFDGSWSPELLLDSETNSATGHLNRLEGGLDLYPTLNSAWRWRGLTYESRADDGVEAPLFTIFAQGRLFESALQYEQRLSRDVTGSMALAYDNYVTDRARKTRSDGVKGELDLNWSLDRLSFDNSIYYFRSYGGYAWGDRILLSRRMTDRMQLNTGLEVTRYNKVTSADRFAFSSLLGATWRVFDRAKFTATAELNSNNIVNYECRAMARLVYILWAEP